MAATGDDYYPLGDSGLLDRSESGSGEKITSRTLAVTGALTGAGLLGRVALQHVPSVETVLPVAIAVGFYAGKKQGALSGAAGFYATNFLVWGGQGLWTYYQALGAASGAVLAAYISGIGSGRKGFMGSLVAGTLTYELVVNLFSAFTSVTGILALPGYFAASLPFALTHLVSTLAFGVTIYGFDRTLRSVYGTGKS